MESVSVSEGDIGLSRSTINHHGQIQLVNQELLKPSISSSPTAIPDSQVPLSHRTIRHSFDERRHDTAIKLRKALHISKPSDEQSYPASAILANDTTETSESRLHHDIPVRDKRTVKDMLHNPIDTIKDKVSGQGGHQAVANVATKEISHGQEVDLVNAHDRVKHAGTDVERLLAVQDLDKLTKERQAMYVRWTVDRHVTKCRILPRSTFSRKSRSEFESKTIQGETVVDWNAYGAHVSTPPLLS